MRLLLLTLLHHSEPFHLLLHPQLFGIIFTLCLCLLISASQIPRNFVLMCLCSSFRSFADGTTTTTPEPESRSFHFRHRILLSVLFLWETFGGNERTNGCLISYPANGRSWMMRREVWVIFTDTHLRAHGGQRDGGVAKRKRIAACWLLSSPFQTLVHPPPPKRETTEQVRSSAQWLLIYFIGIG